MRNQTMNNITSSLLKILPFCLEEFTPPDGMDQVSLPFPFEQNGELYYSIVKTKRYTTPDLVVHPCLEFNIGVGLIEKVEQVQQEFVKPVIESWLKANSWLYVGGLKDFQITVVEEPSNSSIVPNGLRFDHANFVVLILFEIRNPTGHFTYRSVQ